MSLLEAFRHWLTPPPSHVLADQRLMEREAKAEKEADSSFQLLTGVRKAFDPRKQEPTCGDLDALRDQLDENDKAIQEMFSDD